MGSQEAAMWRASQVAALDQTQPQSALSMCHMTGIQWAAGNEGAMSVRGAVCVLVIKNHQEF